MKKTVKQLKDTFKQHKEKSMNASSGIYPCIASLVEHATKEHTVQELLAHLYGSEYLSRLEEVATLINKESLSLDAKDSEKLDSKNMPLSEILLLYAVKAKVGLPWEWTDSDLNKVKTLLTQNLQAFVKTNKKIGDICQDQIEETKLMAIIHPLSGEQSVKDFIHKLYDSHTQKAPYSKLVIGLTVGLIGSLAVAAIFFIYKKKEAKNYEKETEDIENIE
ncbi:MAG: hypothetical protein AAF335_01860 [Bacteroidota bacterium]